MNADKAYAELKNHSGGFLKYHPVNTAGDAGAHTAGQANVRPFLMYKRNGDIRGSAPSGKIGHYGATRPGLIHGTNEVSSFIISTLRPPAGVRNHAFNALSVPMSNYNAVNLAALDHYKVGRQCDLMITGQLSGCTFAWIEVNGELLCTHLRPIGTSKVQLHTEMHTRGRFAAHPNTPLNTYGANDYGPYAVLIGVRRNGHWRLYSQHSNDVFQTITGAWRIYPAPRKVL